MNVLVTGGAGNMGRYVVRELLRRDLRPVVIDLAVPPPVRAEWGDRVTFYGLDIGDQAGLIDIFEREKVGTVVHLAALTGDACSKQLMAGLRINMVGTMNVFEAVKAAGVRRMVMASTRTVLPDLENTVYGPPELRPVPEEHPLSPDRPYEVWKFAGEVLGRHYADVAGFEFAALRFATFYQSERALVRGTRAIGAIHDMIYAAATGGTYTLPSGGDRAYDMLYMKDLAVGVAQAALAPSLPSSAYNIATGEATSMLQFANALMAVAAPGAHIELGPGLDFAEGHYCVMDISRARRELGYAPTFTLAEAAADVVAEVRQMLK